MGALPRPHFPPGSQRELVDALHDLHHQAGWPSLRTLADQAGCSHTTVSAVFSTPRLPSWGKLELLVEAMGGDPATFYRLWLAATEPAGHEPAAGRRIAGRRTELVTVRRHLETGAGLLLVTGEAGIGKTKLVDTAGAAADVFVGVGAAVPLASDSPLLPLVEALHTVLAVDDGGWVTEALATLPPYLSSPLRRILPELEGDDPGPDDRWSQQRLLTAIRRFLDALAAVRPYGLLLEDVHWADTSTLAFLELLVSWETAVPVVCTYRTDDSSVAGDATRWFARVRRSAHTQVLQLDPLSREDTAEQLALLSGRTPAPDEVDRIHRRSRGQPLFTEQLAAQGGGTRELPRLLAELLDERLHDVDHDGWAVLQALGVADRPLPVDVVARVSGVAELNAVLHDLDGQHLLADTVGDDALAVRHPLLAEAVRRRLVAGEARDTHRHLAQALAEEPAPNAAEVAGHWERAAEPLEELPWRIAAAREAQERLALASEVDQWLRALDLWPADDESSTVEEVRRIDAEIRLVDVLELLGRDEEAQERLERLMRRTDTLPPLAAAEIYWRAADLRKAIEYPDRAISLFQSAVEILDASPFRAELVHALRSQADLLRRLRRPAEGSIVLDRARDVCASLEDPLQLRRTLALQAALAALDPDPETVRRLLAQAWSVEVPEPDPEGDALLGVLGTSFVLKYGGGPSAVEAAGRRAMRAVEQWHLGSLVSVVLRSNMARVHLHAGELDRAAELVDPVTDESPSISHRDVHATRVALDVVRGRLDEATSRMAAIDALELPVVGDDHDVEGAEQLATAELWSGRSEPALARLCRVLRASAGQPGAEFGGECLVLAARAAADVAEAFPDRRDEVRGPLVSTRRQLGADPFHPDLRVVVRSACATTWAAELGRLNGATSIESWVRAAHEWERIERPFDAAYCRWRGAQAALSVNQGVLAARLLRTAAHDARRHVPLLEAMRAIAQRRGPGAPARSSTAAGPQRA